MSGRVIALPVRPERQLPRAKVVRSGARIILGCQCGWNRIETVPAEASRMKREHDDAHRAAERRHPAGEGTPGGRWRVMSALLLVAQFAVQAVLLGAVLAVAGFGAWVVWDCTVGPSAQLARKNTRRHAAAGVDG